MDKLRVVVGKPLAAEYVERIRAAEPRVEFLIEPDLLPQMRWPSDHDGDPGFRRTPEQQTRFEALIDSADICWRPSAWRLKQSGAWSSRTPRAE